MIPELSPTYHLPDPRLPYRTSKAMLSRCWNQLSLGPADLDSEVTATLLHLLAWACDVVSWDALARECEFDADVFMNEAARGINMPTLEEGEQ
jgi:hypothetical protein